MLTAPAWAAHAGLRHGFLDRGESAPGAGGAWTDALRGVGVALPIDTVRQVHGVAVVTANGGAPVEADGVVTARRGVAVGVITADCVPALLLAPGSGVVAAVHAGWRGAAAGVLEAALDLLRRDFDVAPADVEVSLGPAIGPCCYQVGPEVRATFAERSGDLTAPAWQRSGDRLRFDLRQAVRLLLGAAGVRTVSAVGPCTACTPSLASYRRDGTGAGRQLSFIGWADAA